MHQAQKQMDRSARAKFSIAACALVMAASAADARQDTSHAPAASQTAQVEAAALTKIRAYCIRSWQNAGINRQDWDDCTQDVFSRVLESLSSTEVETAIAERDSIERRELNRAIWATAQRSRRAVRHAELADEFARDASADPWPERKQTIDQVLAAVAAPAANLSGTQQEIVGRWSNGESIAAIATTLELSPARVSDEKYKALLKLRSFLGVL